MQSMETISYDVTINDHPSLPHLRQQIRETWVEMPDPDESFCFNTAKGVLSVFRSNKPRSENGTVLGEISPKVAWALNDHCTTAMGLKQVVDLWMSLQAKPEEFEEDTVDYEALGKVAEPTE